MRRRGFTAALAASALGPSARGGTPLPWRIVVAYPTGGVSDEIARLLAQRLSGDLGEPVLVEHRPGAGGAIAMEALARSTPADRMLVFSAITPLTLLPCYGPVRYGLRDVAPLAGVMQVPTLVAGTPALAAGSFAAMVSQARAHPGAVRWATTGVGTTGYRVLEAVGETLGLQLTHIPYKGGGGAIQDAVGGQFEVMSTNVAPTQLQHVAAGHLRALAVGAPARLPVLPDVPTLAELGVPLANRVSHFGLFASALMPAAALQRLNAQLNRALAEPALRARLAAGHSLPLAGGVQDFAALLQQELAHPPPGCRAAAMAPAASR